MHHVPLVVVSLLVWLPPIASAQVTPVRSSLEATSRITLSVVDLVDEGADFDDQGASINELGPLAAPAMISSADGLFTANTTASALFSDTASGVFASTQTYAGDQFGDDPTAQSFGHTLLGVFEYDFTVPGDGSIRFQGTLANSGPSSIGFTVLVNVFSESTLGSGFTGAFFEQLVTDQTTPGPTPFDITVPLAAASGSYRVRLRLNHSGSSGLDTGPETGSTSISWTIDTPTPCPADFNGDNAVDIIDVVTFISNWNAAGPGADFNNDGTVNIIDVIAFITVWNNGCP